MLHELVPLTVISAEFLVRHVVPPPLEDRGRHGQAEALGAEGDVVHGQFGLRAEAVGTDKQKGIPREEGFFFVRRKCVKI